MNEVVNLSKPLVIGGEEILSVELREPGLDDLTLLGYPFLLVPSSSGDSGMEIRPGIVLKYIARLSGNPPSAFKTLPISDFSKLQAVVMGFFGELAE